MRKERDAKARRTYYQLRGVFEVPERESDEEKSNNGGEAHADGTRDSP